MKKIFNIIKEFPAAAVLFLMTDISVTSKFTAISAQKDPAVITYIILLYGALLGVLIFTLGWKCARECATAKAEQLRRERRRNRIRAAYRAEFYSITQH